MPPKVRYAQLLPAEFAERLAERPIAYLPLGTLEWHGEHLPLGTDALISEGLMVLAARRLGGIVLPPIHQGPDADRKTTGGEHLQGMDFVDERSSPGAPLPGSCYWVPDSFFIEVVDRLLLQVARAGFKAVFADGHGPSRNSWNKYIEQQGANHPLRLIGVSGSLAARWESQIDHAAHNETSLMLAIRSELVDLSRLPQDPADWPVGVAGEDPRDAEAETGEALLEGSIAALARTLKAAGV